MDETLNEHEQRFLERIERRARFLETLFVAELGVYLPPDESQRNHAIQTLARLSARQKELPYIRPEIMRRGGSILATKLEAMQKLLPHDVQYHNRIRRSW